MEDKVSGRKEIQEQRGQGIGRVIFGIHSLGGGLVAKSCLTLETPVDWSPPGSSVHGISQARILEWVAISFSKIALGMIKC